MELSPWHEGELKMQASIGAVEQNEEVGRMFIRHFMPDQHRTFFEGLPYAFIGAVDSTGNTWASVIANPHPTNPSSHLLVSPNPKCLQILTVPAADDPISHAISNGNSIGILGIDLRNRRRNRMNGQINNLTNSGFEVQVHQSFGNCPQYIQLRTVQPNPAYSSNSNETLNSSLSSISISQTQASNYTIDFAHSLSPLHKNIIVAADTFFVASSVIRENGVRQVDVSHRGGKPGFVRVNQDGSLTIPDFAGNTFFNTLGNILLNPKVGLVFVDFQTGDILQLSGDAEVILDSPEIALFQGAERLWNVRPSLIVYRKNALPVRWENIENGASPNSQLTGSWNETDQRVKAVAAKTEWRKFVVTKIIQESSIVKSFYFEPADNLGIVPHRAGQHLPIRALLSPQHSLATHRSYTISSSPTDKFYRISVKKQGTFSNFLHDQVAVGHVIEALAPSGDFIIDTKAPRPAVFISAGIGITPTISMLNHIIYEGQRTRHYRPAILFYGARTLPERAFSEWITQLRKNDFTRIEVVRALTQPDNAKLSRDYEIVGRLNSDLILNSLSDLDNDYYICGPAGFMQEMYSGLKNNGVDESRIHMESFGASD